jgi:dTDP-4-dehydrorhamnose reductase
MGRILILGAKGQLGRDLCREFEAAGRDLIALSHDDIEVCQHDQVADLLSGFAPDIVINTTAFHNVERCESEVDAAFSVNSYAVRNLAQVCRDLGARLVHISTDYVFGDGHRRPIREDAAVCPLNVYGVSKAAGEFFLRGIWDRHLIVRTSGLYGVAGSSGKGGNFVETMLRLGRERGAVSVVTDQVLSPTYSADLARAIHALVDAEITGIVHVTNADSCSWFDFARTIFDLAGLDVRVDPTTSAALGARVRRPRYSVLANHRLAREGFAPLRPWRQALAAYLEARKMARPAAA